MGANMVKQGQVRSNSVKHGQKGSIRVKLSQTGSNRANRVKQVTPGQTKM